MVDILHFQPDTTVVTTVSMIQSWEMLGDLYVNVLLVDPVSTDEVW